MSWTKIHALEGRLALAQHAETWRKITKNLSWFNNFRHNDDYDYSEFLQKCSQDQAEIVSSKIKPDGLFRLSTDPDIPPRHKILIDLDMDAVLVPSTTPGHHHLYIDHELTWDAYEKLLNALAEAGVIEDGYAAASIRRGCTHLRVPWLRKLESEKAFEKTNAEKGYS